ncbi:MAG TPA: hypothetical protein VL547_00525 [Dinghuibacter sp.]|jgi:hypothetical protein|uniref:hypothetical protein n=1 Tax=Dinghuibacter sp. TaxID=2024697 RepID=UPI002C359819|nr:hypothetical protein [Dinghuibacter sp.]HTJ10472.1 hypothetical protein [Dinghuibacter sp.]
MRVGFLLFCLFPFILRAQRVSFSVGAGLPNLDTRYLPAFDGMSMGGVTRSAVVTGSLMCRVTRRLEAGVTTTYGSVSASYSEPGSVGFSGFSGKLEDWTIMATLQRTFPMGRRVSAYIKTALGAHLWTQSYTEPGASADLPVLAKQVCGGVRLRCLRRAGLFVEAGYGEYVVLGGIFIHV